jgi:hypothetical protein
MGLENVAKSASPVNASKRSDFVKNKSGARILNNRAALQVRLNAQKEEAAKSAAKGAAAGKNRGKTPVAPGAENIAPMEAPLPKRARAARTTTSVAVSVPAPARLAPFFSAVAPDSQDDAFEFFDSTARLLQVYPGTLTLARDF